MSDQLRFGKDEQAIIATVCQRVREEWGFSESFDLSQLISKWERFTSEVEVGYTDTIDEFRYGLAMRDILQWFIDALEPCGNSSLKQLVAAIDERFLFATKLVADLLYDGESPRCRKLCRRLPRKIRGPLLEDIKREEEFGRNH